MRIPAGELIPDVGGDGGGWGVLVLIFFFLAMVSDTCNQQCRQRQPISPSINFQGGGSRPSVMDDNNPGIPSGTGIVIGNKEPRLLKEVKPYYPQEAIRARVYGTVLLECIVQPDGAVGEDIKVLRSLDTEYGLDEEAIKAVRQWIFAPATSRGQPVSKVITIEVNFTIR